MAVIPFPIHCLNLPSYFLGMYLSSKAIHFSSPIFFPISNYFTVEYHISKVNDMIGLRLCFFFIYKWESVFLKYTYEVGILMQSLQYLFNELHSLYYTSKLVDAVVQHENVLLDLEVFQGWQVCMASHSSRRAALRSLQFWGAVEVPLNTAAELFP